jgi:paraquat-inducible protein B
MPDNNQSFSPVPEAKTVPKKRTHLSFVWVIPLIAAVAGVWIAMTKILNQGPEITITFRSADGLEAHKTKIRYNGIDVGQIGTLRISEDLKNIIATAKMDPKTEKFLLKDTKFWVVRPQISGANISGLSTILSGAYVGVEIGKSKENGRSFEALDDAPLETGGIIGHFFTLHTSDLGSLTKGTPIFYRRLPAGKVADYELDKSGKFLNVTIFVQAPYDQFVTADTRFWQASGINVSLTAGGLQVQTESLLSILVGGIAFETPVTAAEPPPAAADTVFNLAKDRTEALRPAPTNPQKYVFIFKESLRGLTVGAPVELEGITIGTVTEIHSQFDPNTFEFSAPVTVEVDPTRFGVSIVGAPIANNPDPDAARRKMLEVFVARGLRGQLKTGNLLSGSRFISLDFFPDASPVTLDWSKTPLEIPTKDGSIESIETGVASVVHKLNAIPFSEIGTNLNKTIASLNQTLAGAQGTLTNADQLLNNTSQMFAPGAALDAQLNNTLQQVGGAAQALRILADYLERHPESLLQGKPGEAK